MDRINVYDQSDHLIGTLPMPHRDLIKRDWIEYPLFREMPSFEDLSKPVSPMEAARIETVAFQVGWDLDHFTGREQRALKLARGRVDHLDRLGGWRAERCAIALSAGIMEI